MGSVDSGGRGRATVIGAGAVGVSAALFLQRDGWNVTLVDPKGAGEGCSYGNAGVLAVGSITPFAMPEVLWSLPRLLLDRTSPVAIRLSYLPRLTPWLIAFLRASGKRRLPEVCAAMAGLLGRALADYDTLIGAAGAEDLVVRRGALAVYPDEAGAGVGREVALKRAHGVRIDELDSDEIRQIAPPLSRRYRYGLLYPDYGHVLDPGGLVKRLAAHFAARGGSVVQAAADRVVAEQGRVVAVETSAGVVGSDLAVIAAGAWSRRLAADLGDRVPLDTERGYHLMLPAPGIDLSLPVMVGDHRFVVTPMAAGVRVAGTAEFAGLDAPPVPARHEALDRQARDTFPDLATTDAARWMGFRPSLPDTLPVIGRSARVAGAIHAFGHGHVGLTSAAATGRAVADLAAGRDAPFDLAPFSPSRYG